MNITVYAASSGQVPAVYLDAARNLGTLIAQRGHALVNGAGRTGLMGATTEGVLASGGCAIGVIPQFMVDEGWHNTDMSELIVTPDMHTRKQTMAEVSGARRRGHSRRVARNHYVEAARTLPQAHRGAQRRWLLQSPARTTQDCR